MYEDFIMLQTNTTTRDAVYTRPVLDLYFKLRAGCERRLLDVYECDAKRQ